jgi:hypothetical protein
MRRLVSTALLVAVLLSAAACTEEKPQCPTTSSLPASLPSPVSTPPPPAGAVLDKAASCVAIKKDLEQIELKEPLNTILQAKFDPALEPEAVKLGRDLFTDRRAMVDKHLATAANAEIRAALAEYQALIDAWQPVIDAAGDDWEKVKVAWASPRFDLTDNKLHLVCA